MSGSSNASNNEADAPTAILYGSSSSSSNEAAAAAASTERSQLRKCTFTGPGGDGCEKNAQGKTWLCIKHGGKNQRLISLPHLSLIIIPLFQQTQVVEDVPPLGVAKGRVTSCSVPVTVEGGGVLNRIARNPQSAEALFAARMVEGANAR